MSSFEQVIEFTQILNQRSLEATQAQMEGLQKQWRSRVSEDAPEVVRAGESRFAELELERLDGKPVNRKNELLFTEGQRLDAAELARARGSNRNLGNYVDERKMRDLGMWSGRDKAEAAHLDRWFGPESGLASKRRDLSWMDTLKESIIGVVGVYNKVSAMTGLPHIPTSQNEFVMMVKQQYDNWRREMHTMFQVSAASGWGIDDVSQFMYELNVQKGLFPGLAGEIDRTALALSRAFPSSNDNELLRLTGDVRRVAFELGESMDAVTHDVTNLGRVTERSADDILSAFLDIKGFAGAGGEGATVSVTGLRESFVRLVEGGYRFGVTLEEAAFLTKMYANELDRGVISVEDLIRYTTGLHGTNVGSKSQIAFEIVDRLGDRKEYRELVAYLRPMFESGNEMSAERFIDVIVTGSEYAAKEEFGLTSQQVQEFRKQIIAAVHEVVGLIVDARQGQVEEEQRYIENVIYREWGLMGEGTPDQEEAARQFKLGDAKIKGGLEDDRRGFVDMMMFAQENAFKQAAGLVNARWIKLANSIKEFTSTFEMPDLSDLNSLRGTMENLFYTSNMTAQFATGGGKYVMKAMYPGSGGGAPSARLTEMYPKKDQGFLSTVDASIDRWCTFFNVNPALVRGMMAQESAMNPQAVSSAGARGLMQIMPGTAGDLIRELVALEIIPKDHPYTKLSGSSLYQMLIKDIDFNIMLGVYHIASGANIIVPKAEKQGMSNEEILNWIIGSFNAGRGIEPVKGRMPRTDPGYVPKVKENMQKFMNDSGGKQKKPGDQSAADWVKDRSVASAGTYSIRVTAGTEEEALDKVKRTVMKFGVKGLEDVGAVRVG